jgi:hypothetical protein
MHAIERRAFVRGAAVGALAFSVSGVEILLTPGAARAQGVPLRTLTAAQAATLEAVGETLVPGARQAGVAHLSISRSRSLRKRRCLKRASSTSARPTPISIVRPLEQSIAPAGCATTGFPLRS